MKARLIGCTALVGAACLVGQYLALPEASAASTAAVSFGNAVFSGYGTGAELHLNALNTGTINLADLEQAFSTASTNSQGLTAALTDTDTGTNLQPAVGASTNAYAAGSGLELGLGASTTAGTDANQILEAGKAISTAPPNSAPVTKSINPGAIPGIGTVGLLNSEATSIYDPEVCPLGQPISYGVGDAANAQLLDATTVPGLSGLLTGLAGTSPVISTAGSGTSTAHSDSESYLNSNGDGTFGLATQARETIAPLTVNLGSAASLQITVSGESVNAPVTLTTVTTGNSTGATATLSNDAIIGVNLVVNATNTTVPIIPPTSLQTLIGAGGINIPLNLAQLGTTLTSSVSNIPALGSILGPVVSQLTGALAPVLSALPNVSLGTIQIGVPPTVHTTGGTEADADFNIAKIQIGGAGTAVATAIVNTEIGHLQSTASTAAPIICPLPVVKTASSAVVKPGDNFVYTIEVPDPAKLSLLDCNLTSVDVVDTISDASAHPTFQVVAVNMGGVVNQSSANNATITWTNLTYVMPNPIVLTITVHVPANTPTGTYLDNVKAVGTASACTGGATGITNLGGVNGTALSGSDTITAPRTTAVAAVASTTTGTPAALPRTGGEGGLWQPLGGLFALLLGGAGLALVRRSRRQPGS